MDRTGGIGKERETNPSARQKPCMGVGFLCVFKGEQRLLEGDSRKLRSALLSEVDLCPRT